MVYAFEQLERPFLEHVDEMRRNGRKWYDEEEEAYNKAVAAGRSVASRRALSARRAADREQFQKGFLAQWREGLRRMSTIGP